MALIGVSLINDVNEAPLPVYWSLVISFGEMFKALLFGSIVLIVLSSQNSF